MQGQTPLTIAVLRNNLDMVELLLSNGADVNSKNEEVGGKLQAWTSTLVVFD